MIKGLFKILFRLVLLAAAAFAAFAVWQYFTNQQADYIEVYNNNDDEADGEYF